MRSKQMANSNSGKAPKPKTLMALKEAHRSWPSALSYPVLMSSLEFMLKSAIHNTGAKVKHSISLSSIHSEFNDLAQNDSLPKSYRIGHEGVEKVCPKSEREEVLAIGLFNRFRPESAFGMHPRLRLGEYGDFEAIDYQVPVVAGRQSNIGCLDLLGVATDEGGRKRPVLVELKGQAGDTDKTRRDCPHFALLEAWIYLILFSRNHRVYAERAKAANVNLESVEWGRPVIAIMGPQAYWDYWARSNETRGFAGIKHFGDCCALIEMAYATAGFEQPIEEVAALGVSLGKCGLSGEDRVSKCVELETIERVTPTLASLALDKHLRAFLHIGRSPESPACRLAVPPSFLDMIGLGSNGQDDFFGSEDCEASAAGLMRHWVSYMTSVQTPVVWEKASGQPTVISSRASFARQERERQVDFKKSSRFISDRAREKGEHRGYAVDYCLPLCHQDENLFKDIREDALRFFAEEKIGWHSLGRRHLLSSQTYCVNFLFPFIRRPAELKALLKPVYPDIEKVLPFPVSGEEGAANQAPVYLNFEWNGGNDPLGENSGGARGEYATFPDAAVKFETKGTETHLVLIEWKYTERYGGEFKGEGTSGEVRRNTYRKFLEAPNGPIDLSLFNGSADEAMNALFYEPLYQLLREQLLACKLEEGDYADIVSCLHVAPEENLELTGNITSPVLAQMYPAKNVKEIWKAILKQGDRFRTASPKVLFDGLRSASDFGLEAWRQYMEERYRL